MKQYNGVMLHDIRPFNCNVYLDASLNTLSDCYDDVVYAINLKPGHLGYYIAQLEMVKVAVALTNWNPIWANKQIHINVGNRAVVEVLTNGRARDDFMATCSRNVWLLTSVYNVSMIILHVRGTTNQVADLLSR